MFFDIRDLSTTKTISGPLRLAKKYMIDDLYQRLVAVLERDWPASYEKWVTIQDSLHQRVVEACRDTDGELVPLNECYPGPGKLYH